jgi:hypothetical protein
MATLRGEPVDRPAVNFYEIGGHKIDPSDPDEFNVYNDPSWRPLLQLAEEQTDLIRMRSSVRPRSFDVQHVPQELTAESPWSEFVTRESFAKDGSHFTRLTINIGGRTLTEVTRRDQSIDTVWTTEHLLKNIDDLQAYLELPDKLLTEEVDVAGLTGADEQVADRGIVMVDTEDPLCAAASLFSMGDFTVIALTEQGLFHQLLEKLARPIYARVEQTARLFPGHLWRIYGPEYAVQPYLPPHLFAAYEVRYTEPMIRTIHKYGGLARIHCHGRIGAVLDYIVEMGADAIDPVEPPPYGDVELAYVRRNYGKQLALFGNLELVDLETMEPEQFAGVVETALQEGTEGEGKGFVLMPSAAPTGRKITTRTMTNYETMVRLAKDFRL